MKVLSISTFFTASYTYASKAQARRLLSNLQDYFNKFQINLIVVTDASDESAEAVRYFKDTLKDKVNYHHIVTDIQDDKSLMPYKEGAQLLIAQMTEAGLNHARCLESDYCWMLEADVLPSPNALRCLLDVLSFDNGYYDVAFAPYPSNGGGSYLGGFGSPINHIYKDFLPHERKLSEAQAKQLKKIELEEAQFQKKNQRPPQEWIKAKVDFEKELEQCSPDGNIWELNAKNGWRLRGWLDFAYPALAKGSIVPVDWVGTGNTLLSRAALGVSHLDGYGGKGTQDLYLGWNCWHPNNLRIGLTTQALSDHVIKVRDKDGKRSEKIVLLKTYYETQGEAKGHLRWKPQPWYASDLGEKYDSNNDGKLQKDIININQSKT